MNRKLFSIGLACLIVLIFIPYFAQAQEKITGPWLWMIAPTEPGQGGAASIDIDSLAVASGGAVTESDVAANGAREGDKVGNYAWTLGQISATGGDNINECLNRIGMSAGNVDHHSSYALFTLESDIPENVTMHAGSDDAIKVWLNGEVVHNNPVDRGSSGFQEAFPVDLIAGDNLLMVKVSERSGGWSMFIGIETVGGVSGDGEQIQAPDIGRPIVQVVYLPLPGNPSRPDVDAEIDGLIKKAQLFFADEMERHGFGRKTFQIEVDTSGNTVVHRGQVGIPRKSIVVYMEEVDPFITLSVGGVGAALGSEGNEGYANIYYWNWETIAHELGHAFGLKHDFRSGSNNYIMSYGPTIRPQLSPCTAEWLDTHRAFNPAQSATNKPTKTQMLSSNLDSPPNAIRLRFRVTDPDGLHQVQLLTPTVTPGAAYGFFELLSYKVLNGSTNTTVEFVTDLTPNNKSVSLMAIDVHGNFTWDLHKFPINITSLLPSDKVVPIPDANLAAAVRQTLRLSSSQTTTTHSMLNLWALDAPNSGITDLTGLEHARNLRSLNLGDEYIENKGYVNNNTVSDLSALSGLTSLTWLELANNRISDISPIAEMTYLFFLSLSGNSISNVSPLAGMTHLAWLQLDSNRISDISPLAGMTQLESLSLSGNSISNVSPLAGMIQVESLSLGGNSISDVSTLAGMTQLKSLSLWDNNISDISVLSEMIDLTSLSLGNNNISDISVLSELTQLTWLYLDNNNISDISALSGLTNLISLYLDNNNISDVSPLVKLNLTGTEWNSTGLYLWNNPLNYVSINTHIPAMQANGVEVQYEQRTPTKLLKISGDGQQAVTNSELPLPLVVQVLDQRNRAFSAVPVTFSIIKGSGKLSTLTTKTDAKGKAKARFTLGQTEGETTIRATASKISQPIQFTITAILPNSSVHLPDTNLSTKIAETLGKPTNASITVADMLTLTSLTANNASISDLTGLQHAANLTTLRLNSNNLSNIDSLMGLTQLTTLSLDNNNLSNITPLVGLTRLETLSLENNKISGIAPLVELTELKTLRLRGNLLSYPSLYTTIPTLRSRGVDVVVDTRTPTTLINIPGTPGVAGTTLQVLVQVQDQNGVVFSGVSVTFTLTAADGHISTSEATSNLNGKAATTLKLGPEPGENTVSAIVTEIPQPLNFTITAIDGNTLVHIPDANLHAKIAETLNKPKNAKLNAGDLLELTRLDARNANIQNLTGIEYANNLRQLFLGAVYIDGKGAVNSNTVVDISALAELTQLTSLSLNNNIISDVSALSGLIQLTWLSLDNNTISDISALSGLTQLTLLYLYNNNFSDISSLTGMTQLEHLSLGSNNISDISSLTSMTRLRYLSLDNNTISDISALSDLTQLTSLSLYNNTISDISALSDLTQLEILSLWQNNISDIFPIVKLNLTTLSIQWNPLSYVSINTHIPAMQAKGIEVGFTRSTPTKLLKISGDAQQAITNSELPLPFVVQVQDQYNRAFAEVPVTFSITKGSGKLSATTAKTDRAGRAQTQLTLGEMGGTITVQASAPNVSQSVQFTVTSISLDSTITLSDANLNAKIAETSGKPTDAPITIADMLALTSLTANNASITDLTGLQHAANLTTLILDGNNLSNIDSLTGLTQLTTLSLDNNYITDVQPFTTLEKLETLSLENNKIPEIAPLVELNELKTLRLRGNLLSYPSLYTTLPTMRNRGVDVVIDTRTPTTLINIPGTPGVAGETRQVLVQVQDQNGVAFLGVPVNFTLTAADGHLSTSEATSNLNGKAITTLTLGPAPGENVVSATVIEIPQPLNFTITTIDGNTLVHIPDVNLHAKIAEALNKPDNAELNAGDMLKLTRLDAPNANIQELTGIENAYNLNLLHLNNNNISDMSALSGLTNLTRLYLDDNNISDISPLSEAELINLAVLRLRRNNISDISALSKLTNLTLLYLDSNNISDISALSKLTNLTLLYLFNNNISDISALSKLTNLTLLHLRYNNISDMSPLLALNLTGTQWDSTGLDIRNNPLNNASIRIHIPAMQAKGIVVSFDNITHPELLIISGDKQEELVGRTLSSPFVVEYRDADGQPKEGVKVTFSIADGDAELTDSSLTTDADGRAQTFLRFGWKLGTITVDVTAEGINSQLTFTASVVLPEDHVPEDVNADGIVNVEDLVLVAATIGTTPPEDTYPNPDVNADGVVNSDDLALVMAALENTPTAPAAVLTAANLQRWIDEAKQLTNLDETLLRGIAVLEQILVTMLPNKTALLANYPNPFNPETWIPYHLAKSAEVTVHIYAVNGTLIRILSFGHKAAGIYEHRNRAAYWDGKNAQGERVASGIYFYTLTAGDFTSTRKMLIRK